MAGSCCLQDSLKTPSNVTNQPDLLASRHSSSHERAVTSEPDELLFSQSVGDLLVEQSKPVLARGRRSRMDILLLSLYQRLRQTYREFILKRVSSLFVCYSCVFFSVAPSSSRWCLPNLERLSGSRAMGMLPQMRQFQKSDLVYGRSPSRLPGSRPRELWVMDYIQIAHVFVVG